MHTTAEQAISALWNTPAVKILYCTNKIRCNATFGQWANRHVLHCEPIPHTPPTSKTSKPTLRVHAVFNRALLTCCKGFALRRSSVLRSHTAPG